MRSIFAMFKIHWQKHFITACRIFPNETGFRSGKRERWSSIIPIFVSIDLTEKTKVYSVKYNGRSDHVCRIGCRYSNGSKEGKRERERKRKHSRRKKSMIRLSYREWRTELLCSTIECVLTNDVKVSCRRTVTPKSSLEEVNFLRERKISFAGEIYQLLALSLKRLPMLMKSITQHG